MTKEFANDIEVLKPMFYEIGKRMPNEHYIAMGQIYIDKKYHGKGLFKGLYEFMKTNVCVDRYSFIITEIDINNKRSLEAHESVGFEKLKDYKNRRIVSLNVCCFFSKKVFSKNSPCVKY